MTYFWCFFRFFGVLGQQQNYYLATFYSFMYNFSYINIADIFEINQLSHFLIFFVDVDESVKIKKKC